MSALAWAHNPTTPAGNSVIESPGSWCSLHSNRSNGIVVDLSRGGDRDLAPHHHTDSDSDTSVASLAPQVGDRAAITELVDYKVECARALSCPLLWAGSASCGNQG